MGTVAEPAVPGIPGRPDRCPDRDGDRGSGTVHALTLTLVLGVLLVAVLLLAQAGIATHRAGKAADLAALDGGELERLVGGCRCVSGDCGGHGCSIR